MLDWLLDNIAGGLLLAAILAGAGYVGRRWLLRLWDLRPWPQIRRVPRTEAETRRLLAKRPPGWEYMHLAGELHRQLARQEPRYRDYEANYVRPSDLVVPDDGFGDVISDELDSVRTIIRNWTGLINGGALARAMGDPGEPGDADRISHVAERLTSAYVALMDWSDRVHGSRRSHRFRRLMTLIARFADQPVQQYRAWVGDIVRATDDKADRIAVGKGLGEPITVSLTLDIADEVHREFQAELGRVEHGERDDPDEDDE